MLLASEAGHVVNTSSVNGFWATLGGNAHTAYSAAKFAVKGFTEALITDFRVNAPHLRASVVMPGHIGTSIVFNSGSYFGRDPKELTDAQVAELRGPLRGPGPRHDDGVGRGPAQRMLAMAEGFRDNAPTTAAEAATIILDGVRAGEWRILVGDDAQVLDEAVRQTRRSTPTSPSSWSASAARASSAASSRRPTRPLTQPRRLPGPLVSRRSGPPARPAPLGRGRLRRAPQAPRRTGEQHADDDEHDHHRGADGVGRGSPGVLVERAGDAAR